MPRGGARKGVVGKAYSNRTDLHGANVVAPQPVNPALTKLASTAVPGQQYGQAAQQLQAQQSVPMAGSAIPQGQGSMGGQQSVPPPLTGPAPGQVPSPFAPSDATHHFMTGVDAGPGQGSEALAPNPFQNNAATAILATLNTIANPSPQVQFTKQYLAMQEQNQMPH